MIYEVKTLIHPVTGQRFKLGRNRWPEALHPCLKGSLLTKSSNFISLFRSWIR